MKPIKGEAWQKVLPIAEGLCVHDIFRRTHIAYSHLLKIIDDFEEKGWVTSEKIGRKRIIHLTETGRMIAEPLIALGEVIKPWEKIK